MTSALLLIAALVGQHAGNHNSPPEESLSGNGGDIGADISAGDCITVDENGVQGCIRTADTDPGDVSVLSQSAYPQASSNKTGGTLLIAGGTASKTITIDDYNNCSGDTVTIQINNSSTVLTEGVDWTAATDNATTATSLASAVQAIAGIAAATAAAGVVYITKNSYTAYVLMAESDATCTTIANNTDGTLEMYGVVNFNNGTTFKGSSTIQDNKDLQFGTGSDTVVQWSTAPNPDAMTFSLGTESRIMYINEFADRNAAYTLAQQTDPTLVIQSSDATTEAQRMYFQHNQTDGVVNVETGALRVDADGIDVYDSSGNAYYWAETHVDGSTVSPGGSGATLTVWNTSSIGYLLDATNEYIYFTSDVEDNWDGVSDVQVNLVVALNANETANDIINGEVVAEYFTEHDDMDTPKTQTRAINHDIASSNSAGETHNMSFLLDYDLGSNEIEKGDVLKLRFRLDSVAGGTDVAAIRFLYGHVRFRAPFPAEAVGTFPTEG
jgi:hypothetical protein